MSSRSRVQTIAIAVPSDAQPIMAAEDTETIEIDGLTQVSRGSIADPSFPIDCGFTNADIMRCAFSRRIGVGPSAYRERLRS